ncbi:MAG: RNA-binding protein [Hyphomicrobiales bacterium]|nr:RNA-binding protein [Hyphomicrobiales bacterium]
MKPEDDLETDAAGSIRMCALTRERREDDNLLRFVLDPENHVTPDIRRKLPGRGVWLTPTRSVVADAVKRKVFARGFKTAALTDADLPELTEKLLRRAALQSLAMGNKAGQAVSGFAKVDQMVGGGEAQAVMHAIDGSDGGVEKINRKYRAVAAAKKTDVFIVRAFAIAELSVALGRENVVHAALKYSGVTDKFVREVQRWLVYNGINPLDAAVQAPQSEKANQVDV